MENGFNNRDFEHFVKQNADQYRMFPSEKVWNNIHHSLHQRNRWVGAALVLLLLTTGAVTGVMLIPSNRNISFADRLPVAASSLKIPAAEEKTQVPVIPLFSSTDPQVRENRNEIPEQASTPANLFIADMNEEAAVVIDLASPLAPPAISSIRPNFALMRDEPLIAAQAMPAVTQRPLITETVVVKMTEPGITEKDPGAFSAVMDELAPLPYTGEPSSAAKEVVTEKENSLENLEKAEFPLTIESVVNIYQRKKSRLKVQAYFTPTVSYRRLSEDNQFLSETQSRTTPSNSMVAISDVENIVTHKPDYGLQLGLNAGYELSPRLTFLTGLQFNVNKYDIRAYAYPSENTTIALMSAGPYISSLQTQTTYRNYSGTRKADWLHNLYFSASIPVGLQLRLSGAGKSEIGIAGTVQPTYILGNRTYLLSTDYKNYAEVPSLIRKWNISTGFEIYAGLSTGKIDWRVGPQVRYQLLSSYKKEYPVKEHLFDFGLKVGIILNK
jgi:hypothetical protein